jgi:cyclopropane-fatty-acyl-phospholipid synthase
MFVRIAAQLVKIGSLEIVDGNGRVHRMGDGTGVPVRVRLTDNAVNWAIALNPRLRVGEAYMDGRLVLEQGTLYDFLDILTNNVDRDDNPWMLSLVDAVGRMLRPLAQLNGIARSRRNVHHHYDLNGTLYDLFLDSDRQYSCAYFQPGDTLEMAQQRKKRHIAAKLLLKPGCRVLDIGCGWGGLALSIAREMECEVVGITLAEEQKKVADARAKAAGLDHLVRFELIDYRQVTGQFDRIVSVGMFEHVGVPQFQTFFNRVAHLLKPTGIALLHAIGRSDGPGATNPWIKKYIFPGGYSPALSEVIPCVERARLWITDVEILRLHYAETLREWRRRFTTNRDRIAKLYDERFCRMWEFYLIGSELAFRRQGHMVWQMQMAKDVGAVPLTRDYVHAVEQSAPESVEQALAG